MVIQEKALNTLCQNIRRKYEYFENKHCIFWSKHGCFTASLDILNTNKLISQEREGFRGSNFFRFILGVPYLLERAPGRSFNFWDYFLHTVMQFFVFGLCNRWFSIEGVLYWAGALIWVNTVYILVGKCRLTYLKIVQRDYVLLSMYHGQSTII